MDEVHGAYISLDLSHSFDLPSPNEDIAWSLDLSAGLSLGTSKYNKGYFGPSESGLVDARAGISLPVTIFEKWSIAPSVAYIGLMDNDLRDAVSYDKDNVLYGITISLSF